MEPKIKNETNLTFGPVRLSYAYLFTKNELSKKYQCELIIPKSDTATIKAINTCIENAKKDGIQRVWGGKLPAVVNTPLKDGDAYIKDEKRGDEYKDSFFVTPKSNEQPAAYYKDLRPITDQEDLYAGAYVYVNVNFGNYSNAGNCGVTLFLNSVVKAKDGEKLGGESAKSASAYQGCEFDNDADPVEDL